MGRQVFQKLKFQKMVRQILLKFKIYKKKTCRQIFLKIPNSGNCTDKFIKNLTNLLKIFENVLSNFTKK